MRFAIVRDCSRNGRTRLSSLSVIVFDRVSSPPLSTKPSSPRPSRPSLSTKAPCSLPALGFGERDQPRDGVLEAVFVISASAKPRAGGEGREAERPARTGPSTTKPRRLPAGAPVNHQAHPSWWATLFGSRGGTRTPGPVVNSHLLYRLSYSGTGTAELKEHRPCGPNGAHFYPSARSKSRPRFLARGLYPLEPPLPIQSQNPDAWQRYPIEGVKRRHLSAKVREQLRHVLVGRAAGRPIGVDEPRPVSEAQDARRAGAVAEPGRMDARPGEGVVAVHRQQPAEIPVRGRCW